MTQTDNLTEGCQLAIAGAFYRQKTWWRLQIHTSSAYKAGRAMGTGAETAQKTKRRYPEDAYWHYRDDKEQSQDQQKKETREQVVLYSARP